MKTIPERPWLLAGILIIILLMLMTWGRRYFEGLFFYPESHEMGSPAYLRIDFDDVYFPSPDGRKLHGYFLKPKSAPKGTLVHCHGNAGNVTSQYPMALFLVEAGYNVLSFDYGGFGRSEGKPTPASIIEDTMGALAYVKTRDDVDKNKICLFGQSLGGAAASEAMVKDESVRCLVLEGAFTTYREMAWTTSLGKFFFFIPPLFITNTGPKNVIGKIAPRPVLLVHGEADGLIPYRFSKELYDLAKEKKALSIIKDFHHLQGSEGSPEYEQVILDFLSQNL